MPPTNPAVLLAQRAMTAIQDDRLARVVCFVHQESAPGYTAHVGVAIHGYPSESAIKDAVSDVLTIIERIVPEEEEPMTHHDLKTLPDAYEELERAYSYGDLTDEQRERMADLRGDFLELARRLIQACPPGRERSLALTNLQQAKFWAVDAVAKETA